MMAIACAATATTCPIREGLVAAYPETIYADPRGFIWIGFYGMGLDRFDPRTEEFIHYCCHFRGCRRAQQRYGKRAHYGCQWQTLDLEQMAVFDVLDPEKSTWQHFPS